MSYIDRQLGRCLDRKAVQWMLDLKNIKHGDNESKLFNASMTSISQINNNIFSVVVNPFGKSYPESGNAEGVSFKTIASYIKDVGIPPPVCCPSI
jgi:hypothetical protein